MFESDFIGPSRSMGAIAGTMFGALWLFGWWRQTHSHSHLLLGAIAIGAGLSVWIALRQIRQFRRLNLVIPNGYRASRLRLYGIINIAYWPLIAITVISIRQQDAACYHVPL